VGGKGGEKIGFNHPSATQKRGKAAEGGGEIAATDAVVVGGGGVEAAI